MGTRNNKKEETKAAEEPKVTNNNDGTKTVQTKMGTRKRN
jgi:hypothetical protein